MSYVLILFPSSHTHTKLILSRQIKKGGKAATLLLNLAEKKKQKKLIEKYDIQMSDMSFESSGTKFSRIRSRQHPKLVTSKLQPDVIITRGFDCLFWEYGSSEKILNNFDGVEISFFSTKYESYLVFNRQAKLLE